MRSVSETWGTTAEERRLAFPCDDLLLQPDATLFRGVTINAPVTIIFRWLCQMRVAPYSYDLIDNSGRQSPRQLIPGLESLQVGQDMMRIFELVAFETDRHITIRMKANSRATRMFGDVACSYVIRQTSPGSSRLLVKLVGRYPSGLTGRFMRRLLPWGDLIMMRRQLLNFKELSEGER
jgi:hypothetical protein